MYLSIEEDKCVVFRSGILFSPCLGDVLNSICALRLCLVPLGRDGSGYSFHTLLAIKLGDGLLWQSLEIGHIVVL